MDTYGVDALEELAKVSRHFGTKPEDRRLNMYIHIWIKLCLEDFMVASFPTDLADELRARRKYFAEQLTREASVSYLDPMTWLDKEYLLEGVLVVGQGIVEAEILEGAAKAIRGEYCSIMDVEYRCRNAVRRGFVHEVADGKYDDATKLRASLALGSGFYMPDYFTHREIDDFEEEAKVAQKLLKPTQGFLSCGDNKEDTALPVRWYSAACVFADICHQLAGTSVSDEIRKEMHLRDIPAAFPYLQQAVLCFNQGRGYKIGRFFPPMKDWWACQKVGADELCSELAEKTQSLALFGLVEELQEQMDSAGDSWSDILGKAAQAANEAMALAETYKEDVPGSLDRRERGKVLASLDVGKNPDGDRRLELMRLARDIGATRFGPDIQLETVRLLADKSPDDRQSIREQGQRLLSLTQDNARIRLCLTKLLNSPRSLHEKLVDEVRDEIDLQASGQLVPV